MQAAHSRSEEVEPGRDSPCPTEQVAHVAQPIAQPLAVNVPVLQTSHVRSLVEVASAVVYLPATHALLTGSHVDVPPMAVNDTPIWHGVQVLSTVAEPDAYPKPELHVDHATHASLPDVALKVPLGHAAHVRSALAVGMLLR